MIIVLILQYNKCNFICYLFSVFILFYLILENMSANVRKFRFLVIFDTCDIVYNGSISLLPPVVLDNLFNMLLTKFLCKLFFWILILFFYFITLNVPLVITMCTSKFSSGRGWSFLWSLELLLKFYLLCHLHRKFF